MRLALRKRPGGPLSLKPVGDQAVLAELGTEICEETSRRVMELYAALEQMQKRQETEAEGILEMVPAYASLLVYYDPAKTDYARAAAAVERAARRRSGSGAARGRLLRIPVCYGGGFGEDLEEAAALARMTPEDLIRIHSGRDYRVYMLGFLPGFPYLGGMDPAIAVPRKQTPRTRIPAGSVGIGGSQTGIYPSESPGGWQLIGRTPLRLLKENGAGGWETLCRPGDTVRFCPVEAAEYEEILRKGEDIWRLQ